MENLKPETQKKAAHPVLPVPMAMPLKIIPDSFHSSALIVILNRILKSDLLAGDLDFLQGRSVSIDVRDVSVVYQLTLSGNRLSVYSGENPCDLSIHANLYDFLSLVSRQEDPDTLVFQRRLVMEGDTELGLSLKNYLDGMVIESSRVLTLIELLTRKTLPVYKRLFG